MPTFTFEMLSGMMLAKVCAMLCQVMIQHSALFLSSNLSCDEQRISVA